MSALDFKDAPRPPNLGVSFDLPPEEAVQYFQAKGLQPTFAWQDMIGEEHDHAFTVAKMMDVDMLGDVNSALDRALSEGRSLRQFKEELIPTLQAKGWWGRKNVIDPMTGQRVNALLGSSSRLQTIFRTNLQGAYAVGAWDMIQSQAEEAPYLIYDAVDDHRTRPEHAALDGTVLPVDDVFWRTHYPPNGWNCRCGVNQYSADELAARGLKTTPRPNPGTRRWKNPRTGKIHDVPTDLDPGWDHNPGQARYEKAQALLAEKAAALPPAIRPPKGKTWDGDGYAGTQAPATVTREQKAARLAAAKEAEDAAATRQIQEIAEKAKPDPGQWKAKALAQLKKTETWQASPPAAKLGAILARAKALQKKNTMQGQLSGYKKNVLAGKPPTPAQMKALDNAPKATREDFLGKLGTAKANAEAKQYLDGLSAKTAPIMEKAALKQLTDNGTAAGMGAKELADQVKAQAAALQAKSAQKAALAGYKKKAIAGNKPTPKQSAAFKALGDQEKASVLAEIDAEKAKAAQSASAAKAAEAQKKGPTADLDTGTPATLNAADMDQVGGQGGSNPGALYQDATGAKWYIKNPPDIDQAKNEILAARLYALTGADVPEVRMATRDGKTAVASKVIDGLEKAPGFLTGAKKAAGAREGFAADAWLANWDVVGLEYDNLLVRGGKAFRVDTGGALLYRAQGGKKGDAFGNDVTEWWSLRDDGTNPQAAAVFGGMDKAALQASARRVADVADSDIRATVMTYGPGNEAARTALANQLIARKRDIIKKADLDPPGGNVSAAQAKASLDKADMDVKDAIDSADARIVEAAKGISIQQNAGDVLRAKDVQRATAALEAIDQATAEAARYLQGASAAKVRAHFKAQRRHLEDIVEAGEGRPAAWKGGMHKSLDTGDLSIDQARVPPDLAPRPGDYDAALAGTWMDDTNRAPIQLTGRQADAMRDRNIPEIEMKGVVAYTGSLFEEMNAALRRQAPLTDGARHAIAAATEGLRKLPQKKPGTYSRGIRTSRLPDPEAFIAAHTNPGNVINWQAFSSASYGNGFVGDIRMTIHTKKDHADVDGVSAHRGEKELLLPPGTKVKVISAEKRGEDWFIELEEVLDDVDTPHQFTERSTT